MLCCFGMFFLILLTITPCFSIPWATTFSPVASVWFFMVQSCRSFFRQKSCQVALSQRNGEKQRSLRLRCISYPERMIPLTTQTISAVPTSLKRSLVFPAAMAFLGGIAFSLDFAVQDIVSFGLGYWGGFFYRIFATIGFSLQGTATQSTLYFIAFFLLFRFTAKRQARRTLFSVLVCIVIAFFWVAGKAFEISNSLDLLLETPGQIVKAFLFLGFSIFLLDQLYLLFIFVMENRNQRLPFNLKATRLYQLNPFWFSLGLILLMWLPYIIACYPGIFCPDSVRELMMYQGVYAFTSHHTVAHPLLLGWFVRAGQLIGSANIGLFGYVLFQVFCFAGFLAYSQVFMRDFKSPQWFRLVCFLIFGLTPYFAHYVTVIVKDNLYSYGVALLVLELIYMIELKGKYWKSLKHIVLFMLASIFTMAFRKNGAYLIYPLTAILLIFWIAIFVKKHSFKPIKNICFALILPIILVNLFHVTMTKRYEISDSSVGEMLSLPLQQTARYVKEYPNEITPEEKAVIDQILPYDRLTSLYNPTISDPIKGALRVTTFSEVKDYLGVWVKQFFRRPTVYFEATMNQNYTLLYPFNSMHRTVYFSASLQDRELLKESLSIEWSSLGHKSVETASSYFFSIYYMPIIGLICNIGIWNILLLFALAYALSRRYWNTIWFFFPLLISIAVVILAPYTPPRYCFPIIYSMPVVLAYLHYRAKLTA